MILELNRNHLTGSIPVELPNYLKNLTKFNLSGNMFASEIPFDLTGMYNLDPSKTDIGYNALMAVDAKLINFLNNKDPDWADTQTVAPIYVDASMPSLGSVLVSWIPILYTADSGGYNVYYSYYSGGPYTKAGSTSSKSDSSFLVTGLPIDSTYYFVVQAFTNPHIHNDNLVQSMYSDEASCTVAGAQPWKTGTSYKTGDFVIYSGKTWRCTYGHSSQTDWHPGAAGITFWVLTDANGQWQSGMAYKVGDVVQYKGVKWRCAYAHTSQVDWYPGAPGLWFWKKI
jgi:chitodextrinase